MQSQILHKTPGGKLVRLHIDYSDEIIERVRIYGDFFLHPEESIGDLEGALVGIPKNISPERIQEKLDEKLKLRAAQLIGVETRTLAEMIIEAVKK